MKINSVRTFAPYFVGLVALAVLVGTLRAFLQHEVGSLGLLVSAQMSFLAMALAPAVLSEMKDRQTLSVYRAMYVAR
jgi:hypothetical protein